MSNDSATDSLVQQVESLYEEKEKLKEELGVSSADEVIKMVNSLTEQLESMYAQIDESNQT